MFEGKIRAALRLISKQDGGPPMAIDQVVSTNGMTQSVHDILKQKHPEGKPLFASAIDNLETPSDEPHLIVFERITGLLIRTMAMKADGAAGPSGIDAHGWRRLYTSFNQDSNYLCEALASVCKRICTSLDDLKGLTASIACRLIALDKCLGVRPIGIGEVVRCILGKAILSTIESEIVEAASSMQVCARHQAGSEAAICAIKKTAEHPDTEATLLVDASNAFNTLNRKVALFNKKMLAPCQCTH